MTTANDLPQHARHLAASGEGRRLREAAGVSLGELAAVVGTSGVVLARWESGDLEPEGHAAQDWARVVRRLGSGHPPQWREDRAAPEITSLG